MFFGVDSINCPSATACLTCELRYSSSADIAGNCSVIYGCRASAPPAEIAAWLGVRPQAVGPPQSRVNAELQTVRKAPLYNVLGRASGAVALQFRRRSTHEDRRGDIFHCHPQRFENGRLVSARRNFAR